MVLIPLRTSIENGSMVFQACYLVKLASNGMVIARSSHDEKVESRSRLLDLYRMLISHVVMVK